MFGHISGQSDENCVICSHCFLEEDRFTKISEDSFIPPGWLKIPGVTLELNSIYNDGAFKWGHHIVCKICTNTLGTIKDDQYVIQKGLILYYIHERGIVYRLDAQTLFANSVPNNASIVSRFSYVGPDGYVCRFCFDIHNADRLVASDIPLPELTDLALIVRPPNRYYSNISYYPNFDFFEIGDGEHDYPTNRMVCPTCQSSLGDSIQEVAPRGIEYYSFNVHGVLYRRFGSYLKLPGLFMYMPP